MKKEAWRIRQDFLITLLILILPALDIYKSLVGNRIELLGISVVEILNGCYTMLFALILVSQARHAKELGHHGRESVFLLVLLGIYLAGHLFNIRKFNSELLATAHIGMFVEVYHIVISYIFPAVILYVFCHLRISSQKTARLLMYQGLVISGTIVITNLLRISLVAYSSYYQNDTLIAGSIFEWGKHLAGNPDVNLYTSRGFFYSANQISAVLSGLTLLTAVLSVHYRKLSNFGVLSVDFLALLMLSTKTGLLTVGLSLAVCLLYPGYQWLRTRQKLYSLKSVVIPLCLAAVVVGLFTISPVRYKLYSYLGASTEDKSSMEIAATEESKIASGDSALSETILSSEDNLENFAGGAEILTPEQARVAESLKRRPTRFGIPREFVELYDVDRNIDFWYDLVQKPYAVTSNFRTVKTLIYEDVLKNNGNEAGDRLWGIGFSSGFPEIERDGFTQNIFYGYIGTALFVIPYFAMLLFCSVKLLLQGGKYRAPEFYALTLAAALIMAASLITGHVFGCFLPNTVLAVALGSLVRAFHSEEKQE